MKGQLGLWLLMVNNLTNLTNIRMFVVLVVYTNLTRIAFGAHVRPAEDSQPVPEWRFSST